LTLSEVIGGGPGRYNCIIPFRKAYNTNPMRVLKPNFSKSPSR